MNKARGKLEEVSIEHDNLKDLRNKLKLELEQKEKELYSVNRCLREESINKDEL